MISITNVLEPGMLLLLIPIMIIMLVILFKRFIRDDIGDRNERKRFRIFILITRTLIAILLVIALAKPFGEVTVSTQGDPKITILIDNTSSMGVMDTSFIPSLKANLEKEIPVTIKTMSAGIKSDLGESVLGYLEKDNNILVITDGNVNEGAELGDVALLATSLNSTLSMIKLGNKEPEVGVYITGPDTSVRGVNSSYKISIINLEEQEVNIRITIDGQEAVNENTRKKEYVLTKDFIEGEHRMMAEVSAPKDFFQENNVFYKTVSVLKKPKILFITKAPDPAEQIFNELYDVTKLDHIPENLNDYYAVILDDMPASFKGIERLADYLIDKEGNYYGNGLFVIGGFNSFDRGDYKGSLLESYLPVYVGKAARQRGSSNIAISIDFSGTTGTRYEVVRDPLTNKIIEMKEITSNIQDVNKALAASVIDSLGPDNTVGVSIFSTQSATVQELQPLFRTKKELIDKISKIQQPPGQSYFHIGLSGAYALLKDNVGSNNIIMITDGNTGSTEIKQATLDTARTLNSRGVKVYIVGTGRNVDEAFLSDIAYNGGGIYFPASQENNLRILFGEPAESKFGEVFDLFILNQFHYITKELELDASLYGFNQVIPKTNALQLVTTQHGEPAVTVWNYGLGRVATLNVFSGNHNLGDLMNKKNSILLTRIANWVIGDPQRKEDYYVIIPDARTGSAVDVIVKSDKYPTAEGMSFTRTGENQYKTSFIAGSKGFNSILGKEYATNYELEYQYLGLNPRLEQVVEMSGGKVFKPSDTDDIVKFVKSVSKKNKTERTTIIWPFVLSAAILFLLELVVRKFREYGQNS